MHALKSVVKHFTQLYEQVIEQILKASINLQALSIEFSLSFFPQENNQEQVSHQLKEAKALILRLEQEKQVAIQDMMSNLQLTLQDKDEAVAECNKIKQLLQERETTIEQMATEKDEFFHRMEKALEESEKKRQVAELKKEREMEELKTEFYQTREAEDSERKALMEELKRDKAEVVALMQKDKDSKLGEMMAMKDREQQEALTRKEKELDVMVAKKEEQMKALYEEKVSGFGYILVIRINWEGVEKVGEGCTEILN